MRAVSELDLAKAPHLRDPARRLRSGAWLLQRSWRHPHRLPAGWRSERFARSVDRARSQLRPIRTLSALADSFARESLHLASIDAARAAGSSGSKSGTSPLEVAYVTRWIELDRGGELHGWRILCQRAAG
jgi:hypothetical protein